MYFIFQAVLHVQYNFLQCHIFNLYKVFSCWHALKRQNMTRMNSTQAIRHNKSRHLCILLTNSSSTFLSSGSDTEVHEQIAFQNFHMHEKKVIFYMFRKNKQATKNCGLKP